MKLWVRVQGLCFCLQPVQPEAVLGVPTVHHAHIPATIYFPRKWKTCCRKGAGSTCFSCLCEEMEPRSAPAPGLSRPIMLPI